MNTDILTTLESAKHKHHHHHDGINLPNPHTSLGPEERFARLLMMLEAQFGSDITPIERPRLPADITTPKKPESATQDIKQDPEAAESTFTAQNETKKEDESDGESTADLEAAELARLQALGIPFPGIEIKIDKHVARVWLEDLEVECANAVMRDRVRVVVERAVETVASMWAEGPPSAGVSNGGSTGVSASKGKMDEGSKGVEVEAKA